MLCSNISTNNIRSGAKKSIKLKKVIDSLLIDEIGCKMTFLKAKNNFFNIFKQKKTKKLFGRFPKCHFTSNFVNKQRIYDYLKFDTFFCTRPYLNISVSVKSAK